jgi:hypothetical protein
VDEWMVYNYIFALTIGLIMVSDKILPRHFEKVQLEEILIDYISAIV